MVLMIYHPYHPRFSITIMYTFLELPENLVMGMCGWRERQWFESHLAVLCIYSGITPNGLTEPYGMQGLNMGGCVQGKSPFHCTIFLAPSNTSVVQSKSTYFLFI